MNTSIVDIIKTLCQDNNISIGDLEKQLGYVQYVDISTMVILSMMISDVQYVELINMTLK